MRIAHVASEVAPLGQTGGLADVTGAIASALERAGSLARAHGPELPAAYEDHAGVECATFTPLYRGARERAARAGAPVESTGRWVSAEIAGESYHGHIHVVRLPDRRTGGRQPPIYLVDCPALYDRDGIYCASDGRDHPDNPIRFGFLCQAALTAASALMGGSPDIWHAHDWQTALIPMYLRQMGARAASVFTIHNLAYQGVIDKRWTPALGLDWRLFTPDCAEYHDRLALLKGGVACADAVTTVSPSYAHEILTPGYGHGLDGFLRAHAANLTGILNGIDTALFDPATDPHIAARYNAARWDAPDGKPACRAALLAEVGLHASPGDLVCGVVSRFAGQKGLDLVAALVPHLHRLGARLVVLGSGDQAMEDQFRWLGRVFGDHVAARIGFDAALSHRIYAGADAILVPSRFEPCGLTQLYAMRYGAVPIARAVGGLRDTVIDPGDEALARGEGTGFRFEHATVQGLAWATDRAARMHRHDRAGWARLARAGMQRDASWDRSAGDYLALYRHIARC